MNKLDYEWYCPSGSAEDERRAVLFLTSIGYKVHSIFDRRPFNGHNLSEGMIYFESSSGELSLLKTYDTWEGETGVKCFKSVDEMINFHMNQ